MDTSTEERTRDRTTWVCDNCSGRTAALRKRCADCGTLRY